MLPLSPRPERPTTQWRSSPFPKGRSALGCKMVGTLVPGRLGDTPRIFSKQFCPGRFCLILKRTPFFNRVFVSNNAQKVMYPPKVDTFAT